MKKITKKIPARTIVRYQCEVCKTMYKTEKQAKKCEARFLEKKEFSLGQIVRSVHALSCQSYGKTYFPQGKVVDIIGPKVADVYVAVSGVARSGSHAFQYEVEFVCPHCRNTRGSLFYSLELKAV